MEATTRYSGVSHRLDILDKNRMIIPVGAAHIFTKLVHAMPRLHGEDESVPTQFASLQIAAKRRFPLKDGTILLTINGDISKDTQFAFDVEFGEGQVVDGESVVATLNQFVQFARSAAQIFADEVFP
jgi:hypothetical protein